MTGLMNLPGPSPIPDFDPQKFFASLFETKKRVILHPKYFFDGMILEFFRLYLIGLGLSCTFSIKGLGAFLAILLTLVVYIIASGDIAHLAGGRLPLAPG